MLDQNRHSHLTEVQKKEFERRIRHQIDQREEKKQNKQRILLGISVLSTFFASQAICLWKRRDECRNANQKLPPIELQQFLNENVKTGQVSTLVVHPHFEVIDVFLSRNHGNEFQDRAKKFLSTFSSGPERYSKDPDLRVSFNCSIQQLECAIAEAQQAFNGTSEIKIEINNFPTAKEVVFIVLSSVLAICLVGIAKI